MRVTVRLPGVLRDKADGATHLDVDLADPATLASLLDSIAESHPALERRLRDERAGLRRYVNFFVNGEECRHLGAADTPLADGTEVQIIPSVAGG